MNAFVYTEYGSPGVLRYLEDGHARGKVVITVDRAGRQVG